MRGKYIVPTRTCRVCSLLRFDGKKWCFSRLSDQFKPLPFPDRSSFQLVQTVCVHTMHDWAVACSVQHWAWSTLPVRSLSRCSPTVLYHCSEDLPRNCCNCSAAGRAQRLEWVRRQLDPPATFLTILSRNVHAHSCRLTMEPLRGDSVSSATRTTGERSLQPPNPSSSPAPTSLRFGS